MENGGNWKQGILCCPFYSSSARYVNGNGVIKSVHTYILWAITKKITRPVLTFNPAEGGLTSGGGAKAKPYVRHSFKNPSRLLVQCI